MTNRIGLKFPFLLLFVFAFTFHPTVKHVFTEFNDPWQLILLSPQMFFFLSTVLILSKKKIPPQQIGITLKSFKKNVLIGFSLGLVPYILLWILNAVLPRYEPVNPTNFDWNVWMIFSLFIFAPVAEEFFFRGVIFHAMRESYSFFVAVLASSLLFMASHSALMIGPLMLGVITAIMTEKTKSLVPGIIFHAMSNGLTLYIINYCSNVRILEQWLFFRW